MASRAQTAPSNLLDLPSLSPDGLVQLVDLAALQQVGENLEYPSGAAVEGQLSDHYVALARRYPP